MDLFRYKKRAAEGPADGAGADAQVQLPPNVVAAGRPPAPAVASEEVPPPRPRQIAERLFREWETRQDNPVKFNREQKAVVALVVGQVEAVQAHRQAVLNGEEPVPVEQMALLLHGQGGDGED